MAKEETRTVTLRLPNAQAEMFEELGEGSINRGVVAAAAKLHSLMLCAEKEIKGMFVKNEWKFLADSLNGTMIQDAFRYSADGLMAHNEDAQLYEKTAEKWDVNVEELNAKIAKLSSAQVDAVYRRVERLWDKNTDLDEWARY